MQQGRPTMKMRLVASRGYKTIQENNSRFEAHLKPHIML